MPPKETEGNQPVETGGGAPVAPPAATPPEKQPAATPPAGGDDEKITLSKKDYNNLISQRDKANNSNGESEAILSHLMLKDAVGDAIQNPEFKKNYPDVTAADLIKSNPANEDEIEANAKDLQARFETIRQDALAKVEVAREPEMTAADRDAKLKELKGPNKPKNAFAQALRLKTLPTSD